MSLLKPKLISVCFILAFLLACSSSSDNNSPYGLSQRPANAACAIPEAANTGSSVTLKRVFSSLSFSNPVVLRQSPVDQNRWYVAEQNGTIRTFLANDPAATLFADLTSRVTFSGEMGLLGLAFHPGYASNHYVYVYYSSPLSGNQSIISRFTANSDVQLDLASEKIILRVDQPYSNHNGGNILFGPDGYLYIGLGDGGSAGDPQDYAQNINSLLGKMLRIDVDKPADPGNQVYYSSPADNPYVAQAGADEIYALGLRNPWRWSFDRLTHQLVAGDVGQDNWEEVDVIIKGGNYGWRCYEGDHAYDLSSGCSAQYISPIHEYDHNHGYSITGGYVYRGTAIPALVGTYLFSDYYPGPIWGLSDPYGTPTLIDVVDNSTTDASYISSFAEDADGELYVLSRSDGYVYRIEAGTDVSSASFPTLLSQTGCVDAADATRMASGLIPYDVNASFWSDGALKDRWFAIPDGTTISIGLDGEWTFPDNSVLVKNFRLNNKLVETRLLVKHLDGNWAGYSYEWNDDETDASLVLNGKTKDINGQIYIYPGSSQCMFCHTDIAGVVLGPEIRQMNRDFTYSATGITANQLTTLDHIGMFSSTVGDVSSLPRLTQPGDTSASITERARAYLYINCSQCHRQGGTSNVALDFNITTAEAGMNVCKVTPSYNIAASNFIVSPADADDSSLYHRMKCREGITGCTVDDQMPPLGSTVVDNSGMSLLADYIKQLIVCPN
jgi:uncharacterized repeat protein (TIGR03806 family)